MPLLLHKACNPTHAANAAPAVFLDAVRARGLEFSLYSLKTNLYSLPMMTLRAALNAMTKTLQTAGADSPRLSAEVLLAKSLDITREDFLLKLALSPNATLTPAVLEKADSLTARRAAGEPVAYITGEKEFYGRPFKVTANTLIPRPETELLVDRALDFLKSRKNGASRSFADFGTGSGCIAVTLALEAGAFRPVVGLALDKSAQALQVAAANARAFGAANLSFCLADFYEPPLAPGSLDLLAANPPYVSPAEYASLSREVKKYEPKSALVPEKARADSSGLEDVLFILEAAALLLKPGGLVLVEAGSPQGPLLDEVTGMLRRSGQWKEAGVEKDLAGLPRLVIAEKRHI